MMLKTELMSKMSSQLHHNHPMNKFYKVLLDSLLSKMKVGTMRKMMAKMRKLFQTLML